MTSVHKSRAVTYYEMKKRIRLAAHEHDKHPTYRNALRLREAQLLCKRLEMEDRVKRQRLNPNIH